jgi:hypothetical protein
VSVAMIHVRAVFSMNQPSLQSNIWKYAVILVTNKRTYMSFLGVYFLLLPQATPKALGMMMLIGTSGFFEHLLNRLTVAVF